jgi:hypothetical protein
MSVGFRQRWSVRSFIQWAKTMDCGGVRSRMTVGGRWKWLVRRGAKPSVWLPDFHISESTNISIHEERESHEQSPLTAGFRNLLQRRMLRRVLVRRTLKRDFRQPCGNEWADRVLQGRPIGSYPDKTPDSLYGKINIRSGTHPESGKKSTGKDRTGRAGQFQ